MEISKSQTYFQRHSSRELNGFTGRKRLYYDDLSIDFRGIGALAVEHNGEETLPMALSFCKTSKFSNLLAVSDENGYVSLFDTHRKFPTFASHRENADKARVCDWVAHDNAVFDICWIKDDTHILTASGDQTMKLWDAQELKCMGVLMGHTGSVKSVCAHPNNADLIVSGSRDGSFATWDLRCQSSSRVRRGDHCVYPTAVVSGSHILPQTKRGRLSKAASKSVTSVLYLKDEVSIATAGAVNSTVKFWDSRKLKTAVTQTSSDPQSTEKVKRLHGVSSLSQDLNGVYLSASCMDSRIYLYNMLQLENGPVKSFSGCQIESFFIKSAISPDAAHILSGSSDGNAYIWKVNKHQEEPICLKSHDGEVTAVDWCHFEAGKLATCADDFTVRVWDVHTKDRLTTRSPSSIRRRIMAIPPVKSNQLLTNEKSTAVAEDPGIFCQDKILHQTLSPNQITMPNISTPESKEKKHSSEYYLHEILHKTPEAASESPSSVLNPPSSIKRTIRDYFLAR